MNVDLKETIKKSKFYHIDIDLGCFIIIGMLAMISPLFNFMKSIAYSYFSSYYYSILYDALPYILILGYSCIILFYAGILLYRTLGKLEEYPIRDHLFIPKLLVNTKSLLLFFFGFILFVANVTLGNTENWLPIIMFFDFLYLMYLSIESVTYQNISKSITEISNGNIDYKMETLSPSFSKITEQLNHISDGLSQALEEKLKSERLKTDLVANVSHDLRTPLTSIINYIGLLQKQKPKDKKTKQYLKVLETKAEKLKNLTDDLINISKITSGNEPLTLETMNFSEIILQANGEFAEKFESKNLNIITKLECSDISLTIDSKKMGRVLENIYGNIYKYALDNTRVYIELKQLPKQIIFTTKNISRDKLNISTDELMERFVQGDSSRNVSGNGLGLAITKSLIELHQGSFELFIEGDLFMTKITLPKNSSL